MLMRFSRVALITSTVFIAASVGIAWTVVGRVISENDGIRSIDIVDEAMVQKGAPVREASGGAKGLSASQDAGQGAEEPSVRIEGDPLKLRPWKSPFPNGLGAAVRDFFHGGDLTLATQLADGLLRCEFIGTRLDSSRRQLSRVSTENQRTLMLRDIENLELQQRDCQTLEGSPASLRRSILAKAYEAGQVGVAAKYFDSLEGVTPPSGLLRRLMDDAQAGDVAALGVLARGHDARISVAERAIYLHALSQLSTDSDHRVQMFASSGFKNAIRMAISRGEMPSDLVIPEGVIDVEFYKKVLVGRFGIEGPASMRKVEEIVAAVRGAAKSGS